MAQSEEQLRRAVDEVLEPLWRRERQRFRGQRTYRILAPLAFGFAALLLIVVFAGALAAAAPLTTKGVISGHLGYEGGAYPGGFHPTSGLVKLKGQKKLGPTRVTDSGAFSIHLNAGHYTLIGCGGTNDKQCGPSQEVNVDPGVTTEVQLVWLFAP